MSSPAAPGDYLAGNWLLFGALPTGPVLTLSPSPTPTNAPGFALSMDVTGNQITAALNLQTTSGSCGSFGTSFGPSLTGTVAPDGTFTLSSPSSNPGPFAHITITGTVPASADAPWTGSYTVSSTGLSLNNSPPCTVSLSEPFTATAIKDVDGVFVGAGSFATLSNPSNPINSPIGMQLTLHQGGTLYGPRPGQAVTSRLALNGSVQIQGLPCFTQGATSTTLGSVLDGNRVQAAFQAADGTQAMVSGYVVSTDATQISIDSIQIQGGACTTTHIFFLSSFIVHS